ncbi:MAG TPA: ATP-binding protein [Streptosporangiaceae bacterium]|jgi:anti-sigma regulatory factor (Ser/Thr protein kinase)
MVCSTLPVPLKKVWLRNEPAAASNARREVILTARAWAIAEEIIDRLELCTSEIVTNAVQHAPGSAIRLLLTRTDERLRVEVHDSNGRLPSAHTPDPYDESGRGLSLVAASADDHGAYLTNTGKVVWFDVIAWPKDLAA